MEDKLNLVVIKNPFDRNDRDISVIEVTEKSLLALRDVHFPQDIEVTVTVNGAIIPDDYLDVTYPQKGDYITFIPVVSGGDDGKNILRAVLMIAVMIIAPEVGLLLGKAGSFLYYAGMAATSIVGGLLINALIPPSLPSSQAPSSQYSWSPQTIQKEGVVCPRFYGRNRLHGNIINAYIETINSKHNLYTLLSYGIGPYMGLKEAEIQINNQNISNFGSLEIYKRMGEVTQPTITHHNQAYTDTLINQEIFYYADATHYAQLDGYTYTTQNSNFHAIQIELQFPTGLVRIDSKDGYQRIGIKVEVSIQRVGDTVWKPLALMTTATTTQYSLINIGGYWSLGCRVNANYILTDDAPQIWYESQQGSTNYNDHNEGDLDATQNSCFFWRWVTPTTETYLAQGTIKLASKSKVEVSSSVGNMVNTFIGNQTIGIRQVISQEASDMPNKVILTVNNLFVITQNLTTQIYKYSSLQLSETRASNIVNYNILVGNTASPMVFNAYTSNNLVNGSAYKINIKYLGYYWPNVNEPDFKEGWLMGDTTHNDRIGNLFLSKIRTITYGEFQYPRNVLIGFGALASAQVSGSFDVAVTMDCAGVFTWNGTSWKFEYSNNPAWIIWDILTQPVVEILPVASSVRPLCNSLPVKDTWYQGGLLDNQTLEWQVRRYDAYDPSMLDLVKFKELADYCNELVPKKRGESAYLSTATTGNESIIYASAGCTALGTSGTGYIFDKNLNVNAFSWAGNTGTSLTGCVGVTAHPSGSVIVTTANTEKRHTFNGGFDTETTLWDAVITVCQVCRAIPIWQGTKITLAIDSASQPVNMVTIGNIVADSFEETFLPLSDRCAEIEVDFINSENNYTRDVFTCVNKDIKTVTNRTNVQIVGITKPSEAWRAGMYQLYCNQYILRSAKMTLGIDSISFTVGDVIQVQHDIPQWGFGGRVVAATATSITLDREVAIAANTSYSVMARLSDDTLVTKTVTNIPGNYTILTVSSNYNPIPQQFDLYSFGETNKTIKPFRVIGIQPSNDLTASISLVEYNASIYSSDYGIPPEMTLNYSSISKLFDVTDLSLVEKISLNPDSTVLRTLVLSFNKPVNSQTIWKEAELWYTINDSEWVLGAPHFLSTYLEIPGAASNTKYTIKVVSVDMNGNKSFFTTAPEVSCTTSDSNLSSITYVPISGLRIKNNKSSSLNDPEFGGADVTLTWNPISVIQDKAAAGAEPAGAYTVNPKLQFRDYEVIIKDINGVVRRTEYIYTNEYTYTHDLNSKDGIGAVREFYVTVRARDKDFNFSIPATIKPINPAPAVVSNIHLEATIQSMDISFSKSVDMDTIGYRIFYSTTQGFTPIDKPASEGGNVIDVSTQNMFNVPLLITASPCNLQNNSNIITANTIDFFSLGVRVGQKVATISSSWLPVGTQVESVSKHSITLNHNATVTGTTSLTIGYPNTSVIYYLRFAAYDKFGYEEVYSDGTKYFICEGMNISSEYSLTIPAYTPNDTTPPPLPTHNNGVYGIGWSSYTENLQAGTSALKLTWDAINPTDPGQNDLEQYEFRGQIVGDIYNTYYYWSVLTSINAEKTEVIYPGLKAGVQIYLSARAMDRYKNSSAWTTPITVTIASDTSIPEAPTNLTVTPSTTTPGALDVNFTASISDTPNSDFAGYELYKRTSNITPMLNDDPDNKGNFTNKVLSGLIRNTTYYIWVRSIDISGNKSAFITANALVPNVAPGDFSPIATPTGLAWSTEYGGVDSQGIAMANVTLTWNANTEYNIESYIFEYSSDNISWYDANFSVKSPATSTKLFGLATGWSVYIRLKAKTITGVESIPSSSVHVITTGDTTAPAIPTFNLITYTKYIGVLITSIMESDLEGYEVYASQTPGFTPNSANIKGNGKTTGFGFIAEAAAVYYVRVRAYDKTHNYSNYSAEQSIQASLVSTGDILDFSIQASKLNTKAIVLAVDSWADNSNNGIGGSLAGNVWWSNHLLYYNGLRYNVATGTTALKYIYWDGTGTLQQDGSYNTSYLTSAVFPSLSDGQFFVATNIGGIHDLAWNAIANEVIGTAYIATGAIKTALIETGAITTALIGNAQITNAKIADLSAAKINAGVLYINDGSTLKSSYGGDKNGVRDGCSYWYSGASEAARIGGSSTHPTLGLFMGNVTGQVGVWGIGSGTNEGVHGASTGTAPGVLGTSSSGHGVSGTTSSGNGINGSSSSGNGVYGSSSNNDGVYGISSSGYGVFGISSTSYGGYFSNGVYGISSSTSGVVGNSTSSNGVLGISSSGNGVYGSASGGGHGVRGAATGGGYAGYFSGGVYATGAISTTNIAIIGGLLSASTPGTVTNKLPIYSTSGSIIGWIPVYNSIA